MHRTEVPKEIVDRNGYDLDLQFLYHVASNCYRNPVGRDNVWQAAPVQGSIQYAPGTTNNMEAFEAQMAEHIPILAEYGRRRAKKAYVSRADTITKPSYINRLTREVLRKNLSQLECLERRFVQEPYSGGLVFSIFEPKDLQDRHRPGYVPCLVSGSFLLHKSEIHLNAFFRSVSILEFGIHDLLFLRQLQKNFVEAVSAYAKDRFPKRHNMPDLCPGPLNIQMARAIIQRRLARNAQGHILRDHVYDTWVDLVLAHIDSYYDHPHPAGNR